MRAENPVTLCDMRAFVDGSDEAIARGWHGLVIGGGWVGRAHTVGAESSVQPVFVVVVGVLVDDEAPGGVLR